MVWPVALFGIIIFLWTKDVLFEKPKKEKTPEEKLGEAIGEYLKAGIKIRKE